MLNEEDEASGIWARGLEQEEISRNCGKQAGGVVLAPTQITDCSRIYCEDTGSGVVTQFDKDEVEEVFK